MNFKHRLNPIDEFENTQSFITVPQMKYSLALNQRKVFLYSDITEDSIFECLYYLNKLRYLDTIENSKNPIDIVINSDGGNVYDCLSLISYIEDMKKDGYIIRTINMGRAFSAGFLLSIVGSKRIAYQYSRYMIHDISSISYGKIEAMRENMKELESLKNIVDSIILKYTKLTDEDLKDIYVKKSDRFFDIFQAEKYGFVDEIH